MIEDTENFIEKTKSRINKIPHNVGVDLGYNVSKFLTKPTSEIKKVTDKDRFRYSILGGLLGLASQSAISKLILRNKRISIPSLISAASSGAVTGYFTPDIGNVIRKEKRGKISSEQAKKTIRKLEEPSYEFGNDTQNLSDVYRKALSKKASLTTKTLGAIGKTLKGTGSAYWKGMVPGKNPSFGRRALSYGVRGGTVAGVGYGGYRGIKRISGNKSGNNYTTFLRNQLLAGNVQPNELSQQDLIAVRKLGMR